MGQHEIMIRKEDYLHIGNTGRTHGLLGELACKLTVDLADWISDEDGRAFLMLEENGLLIPFRIEGYRTKSGDVDLIKFAGVNTKEEAEWWSNIPVWLAKDVVDEDRDESPLENFALFTGYQLYSAADSTLIGEIVDVDESTINTLLAVKTVEGGELLFPLAQELITSIDEDARHLTLIIAEGLLSDDAHYDIH